ncbi:hypothetical protein N0V83_009385 [Neocucurbitaria cava]|uniref:Uncharacterized protein n=1 Tax=Neocucurbitaria cava TaxID=798079 RepID=A0A9W9CHH8_9PLEO|nr:hypothetical protein N0V83_009385 [Neocucurbitaria cava]
MRAKKPYAPASLSPKTNSLQSASSTPIRRLLLSPLATPFQAPESIEVWSRKQQLASTPDSTQLVAEDHTQDLLILDAEHIDQDTVGDEFHAKIKLQAPSPPIQSSPLISEPRRPAHIGRLRPSSPVESFHSAVSAHQPAPESVVRLTKHVWDSMGTDLQMLTAQKRALEAKLARLEHENELLRSEEKERNLEVQIGKLRYQNEINRDQKASMGRSLNLQEVEIKNLQLLTDDLAKKLSEAESDLNKYKGATTNLEDHMKHTVLERDDVLIAQTSTEEFRAQIQDLAATLAEKERIVTDLRQKHLEEQMKVTDLEDEIEALRSKGNQDDIGGLEKLREKATQYDLLRKQVKGTEQQLQLSQERLARVANEGDMLRGAAHLVAPNPNSKLPKHAIACFECYSLNLPCDSKSRCQSCTDRNSKCVRWRCSLKQKLGECPLAPCKFPHDGNGWLILQTARPEW